MIGIVVSGADSASEHIGEHLLDVADWRADTDDSRPESEGGGTVYRTDAFELREFDNLHLSLDGVGDAFGDIELLVFASRHSGETGPLLTAHHTGNVGPAEHGGEPNDLARACPNAHSAVTEALRRHAPDGYEVGMECTHHGPSHVGVPSMFVEVGSAEPQWEDSAAARAVANAILDLRGVDPDREPESDGTRRHLVGFGGGHYAPRFGRIVRETDWAVGHLAADWGLDAMGEPAEQHELLEAAFTESAAEFAVVDGDHPELEQTLTEREYRVVSETWVRAVDGVDLGLVDRLETALTPVANGLRFGEQATDADPSVEFETTDLPAALLDEVQGIDQSRALEAVSTHALAFETTEGGNRVAGQGAVASTADYDQLVDEMVALLRDDYDDVERDGDTVVARKSAFDPAKARTLGVPEGPKFGKLADGDSVSINGETIPPSKVRTNRERRFSVPFNS